MKLSFWLFLGIILLLTAKEAQGKKPDKNQKKLEKEKEKGAKKLAKEKEKEAKKLEKEQEKERKKLEKEPKYLNGYLAETDSLPLSMTCEGEFPYVRAGKITFNSVPVSEELQKLAEKECSTQMDVLAPKGAQKLKRSTCNIWLQELNFMMNETDTLRAVYQCYTTKPIHNDPWVQREETKIAFEEKSNKKVVLKCKGVQVITHVMGVMINEVPANVTRFPELGKQSLTRECFGQTVDKMRAKGNSQGTVKCDILNKNDYGGSMRIVYQCRHPHPSQVSQKK